MLLILTFGFSQLFRVQRLQVPDLPYSPSTSDGVPKITSYLVQKTMDKNGTAIYLLVKPQLAISLNIATRLLKTIHSEN